MVVVVGEGEEACEVCVGDPSFVGFRVSTGGGGGGLRRERVRRKCMAGLLIDGGNFLVVRG